MGASATVRWHDAGKMQIGSLKDCEHARQCGRAWIDVLDPDEATMRELQETFSLHPLAVEDCLHFPQRPKLDIYEHGLFVVWVMPEALDGDMLDLAELDVFIGSDYLITVRREEIEAVDKIAVDDGEILSHGPEWTLHAILDRGVDMLFPIIDRIGDELDELEDSMLEATERTDLRRLFQLKRLLRELHRAIGPERDILRGLARYETFISPDAYLYFQDVADHLARVQDAVDTYRDMTSGIMDIYLSSVSNRLNIVMKRLTIVATIFMPLTFIAGVYGMNFKYMPEIYSPWGYPLTLAAMVAIVVGMLVYFKKKDWW